MFPSAGAAARTAASERPPWWMLVLAVPFIGYYGLLIYCDLTRPEPAGVVVAVEPAAIVVRAVVPDTPAAHAGLLIGDRVLTANKRAVRSRLDWLAVEMNLRIDQPLQLEVAGPGGQRSAVLVLNRAPWRFWTTTAGVTLVARSVQLITLALALLVAFRRPADPSARIGAWALATVAIYSIVWPYQMAAIWRALPGAVGLLLWIPFASSLCLAPALCTFFAAFPRPILRSPWSWLAVWAPMVPVLFLQLQFAWRVVYRPGETSAFIDWTTPSAVVTAGYTLAAVAIVTIGYRRLTDLTERRRVRTLVVGASAGLLSALPVVAGYWGTPSVSLGSSVFSSPAAAAASILALALPLSFAYAILRHRLFDLRLIVRRGLQYALARRVLVSIVPGAAAIFLLDLWINRQSAFADILRARGWLYVGLAGLALVARVRRDDWLDGLDRRFFRERLNAERLLRGIGNEVRRAASLDAVAPRVVADIDAALHPEFVALLLRSPRDPRYRAVATAPPSSMVEPWSADTKLIGLLQWLRKPLQLALHDRAWLLKQLPSEEVDALARAKVELLVPVRLGRETTEALFVLGRKRSEEAYSAEDEDLLMAIADSLALLIERAPVVPEAIGFEECPTCGTCYDLGARRCSRDDAPLTVLSLPRLLGGRYRLERRIGRGGMGTVYAAVDTALNRRVAAKLLRDDLVMPGAAERFQVEARLGASLAHPNIVTVHDVGVTASGRAFLIMELLDGVTLRDELRQTRRLPPARVQQILRGVSAAVEAAHERQMVHRDLKPENVFLCRNSAVEVPKVLDFGLAKALEASARLTMSGQVAGTLPYMAPEHLAGGELSADWDLWALAVMAFEMITGTLPVSGAFSTTPDVELLPAGLRQLFARALSPNPLNRPTSVREFCDALNRELGAA